MRKTSLLALGLLGLGFSASASAQQVIGAPPVGIAAPAVPGAAPGAPIPFAGQVVGAPAPVAGGVVAGSPIPWNGLPGTPVAGSPISYGGVDGSFPGSPAPGFSVGTAGTSGPIHPYSYYIEFPNPARTYVPYGPTDTFEFRGQAYGHAYDRWTWSAMSTASPGVGRYYQLLH